MSDERTIKPNAPADFTPQLGDYKTLQSFRYWCQKVLPLVYDDSLSYYELLCKVIDYLNKSMEDVETLHGDVTSLLTAYEELQSYVNNYFSTLDVQEEINNKLDEMFRTGQLDKLLMLFIPYGTPEMYGAKGDGVTDDTNAFIEALKHHDNILCTKTYLLSESGDVSLGAYGTVKYCINLTDKKINGGTFICNDTACFFSVNNSTVDGCTFIHNNVNQYYKTSSCVGGDGAKNINVLNIKTNVPILQVFNGSNCIVKNNIYNRSSATLPGSIVGFYNSKFCLCDGNNLSGGCGDGDCGSFGVSSYCKFINNTLNAFNETYTTKGLQGLYIDSSSVYCSVINNTISNYYYGIDVKTNEIGIIISENVCECKIGIAIRRGEVDGSNYLCTIANNVIKVGSNEDLTIIANINGQSITNVGIYLESCEYIKITNNTIIPVGKKITAYIYELNSIGSNYIENCVFERYNKISNIYLSGFCIVISGQNCETTISNCRLEQSRSNLNIYAECKAININNCYFLNAESPNIITGNAYITKCEALLGSNVFGIFSGNKLEISFSKFRNDTSSAIFNTINSLSSVSINNIINSNNNEATLNCKKIYNEIVYQL